MERRTVHVADMTVEPGFSPIVLQHDRARSVLAVPLLRDTNLAGVITIWRREVRPFTDQQIALVQAFADQAVIAIENTRLLNELRESAAAADRHRRRAQGDQPLDLRPADGARYAGRVGGATLRGGYGVDHPADGDASQYVASYKYPPNCMEFMRSIRFRPAAAPSSVATLLEGRIVHVADVLADPEYTFAEHGAAAAIRTMLGVPLLREGTPIGVIALTRNDVRPFTDKQIELVTTFADQAVIAIENVRLFDEIQDKSRQLAEASQHKSQFLANMSHELRTPLNAILGYTELILDSVYGEMPEKARSVLDRVQRNGRHLLGLINDVLDLSKIEAGQLTLSLADYSLKNVIQTVFSAVEPLANQKQIALKIEVTPRAAAGTRRRTAAHAGSAQPRRQCDQVHRSRGSIDQRLLGQRIVHCRGARYRPWHFRGRPGQAVPGVSAGRQFDHSEERWHWAWPSHLKANHRDAWRTHLGGVEPRSMARPSHSRFPSLSKGRRGQRDKAHSGGRGSGGQPANPARSSDERGFRNN